MSECKQCDGPIGRAYVRFVAEEFTEKGEYPSAASLVATDAGVFCDKDCLSAYTIGVDPAASLANRLEFEMAMAAQAFTDEPF